MQANPNMEFIAMMVTVPVVIITCAWVLKGLGHYLLRRRALLAQWELQSKLVDKLGASPELLRLVESNELAKALEHSRADSPASPYHRILGAVQAGIVLAALGIAFLALDTQAVVGGQGFSVIGALALALGVGFLLSGAAAFLLSRSWGLIDHASAPDEQG